MSKTCPVCGKGGLNNLATHIREAHSPEDFGLTSEKA